MSVSSLTGVNTTADIASTAGVTGNTSLGKDAFLTLLTTQLQNQDPTNPVSNEQFIAQLAQFSQLEELQNLSGQMDALYMLNASMNNAAMTNLIGQGVVATSDTFAYDGTGTQDVYYDAAAEASGATVTISDADGNVVYSGEMGALAEGEGAWTWDGTDQNGQPLPEGQYTFTIAAVDVNGNSVDVTGLIRGTVDEMDFASGSASPSVDGVPIDMGDILRLLSATEESA
jgi:flagellar basal-body rod modification protein FlgD